jgi:hypothetical protein
MKQLQKLTIGILIVLAVFSPAASVQTASAQISSGDQSGTGGAVSCRNGGRDYGNFLSALISYDGFVEYWKDILVRYNANMCLYTDIDSLLMRIDKTRQQIRNAFYICSSTAATLKVTYYQLEAELYFLRKYVNPSNGQIIFASTADLTNNFLDYVVTQQGWFSTTDAQTLLNTLFSKYQAKQSTYTNCADPTWGNIIQKWNEFKASAGGLGAIQQSMDSIQASAHELATTPWTRTGGFLGGLVDAKINGLTPAEGWADISKAITANLPSVPKINNAAANSAVQQGFSGATSQQATSGFSFDQFNNAVANDQQVFSDETDRANFLANYQATYQSGTANYTDAIMAKLKYLDDPAGHKNPDGTTSYGSIGDTFQYIDQTAQCVKGIVDKLCS